jgi:hypothetical protein
MLEAPTKQRASSVDVFGEDVGHDGQLNCSDGQDTTMKGLMVETNGTSDERTPSSSPNSTSNLQHTSSKPGPSSAAAPAPGRGTSLQSQHSYLKEHLKQQQEAQEQGLEEDSTSQYRHGLTATGAVRSEQLQLQETRAESGPASQSAQGSMQAMQQMPDTRTTSSSQQQQAAEGEDDEAATGTDGGDEAAQAQVRLCRCLTAVNCSRQYGLLQEPKASEGSASQTSSQHRVDQAMPPWSASPKQPACSACHLDHVT